MRTIDLRSDFLARPTPEILRAMTGAADAPKGYGATDDPTQRRLEALAAEMLGKEDALYVPTCMMANLIALRLLTRPGEAVVLDENSHIYTLETGALAHQAGCVARPLPSGMGEMAPRDIAAAIRQGGLAESRTAVVAFENTHNKAGGVPLAPAYMDEVRKAVPDLPFHLDGSRIFNAATALDVSPAALTRQTVTVAISLNKAICAPVGGLLAGPRDMIRDAVRHRHMLGGGWKPLGMLAAAAIVGLRTQPQRLGDDHASAREIAVALAAMDGISIDLATVRTNIVRGFFTHASLSGEDIARRLKDRGVAIGHGAGGAFRIVTHRDITPSDVGAAIEAFRQALLN